MSKNSKQWYYQICDTRSYPAGKKDQITGKKDQITPLDACDKGTHARNTCARPRASLHYSPLPNLLVHLQGLLEEDPFARARLGHIVVYKK